jgi:fructokinase
LNMKTATKDRPVIIGLGEVLWDLLPSGAQMGGAPANFAYHARALGADAGVISRVGNDPLGRDILKRFEALGLPTDLVQRDDGAPTGTVTVQLGAEGVPQFTIHEDVAWDRLAMTEPALAAVAAADAVCFGSLGQRCEPARSSIQRLVAAVPSKALRIFDINLRQHFYSREIIECSLQKANLLKLNDAELPVLAAMFGLSGPVRVQLERLAGTFNLEVVALTRGPHGSLLFGSGGWSDHGGLPVEVRDTVGAGDAFTAAMTLGLLAGWDLDRVNDHANQVARYVCSCSGATPPLPGSLSAAFIAPVAGCA